jgi:hypothetical protein
MAAGDNFINCGNSFLSSESIFRSLFRLDSNNKPYMFIKTNLQTLEQFGNVVQYIDGTIVGNEFIDKSGNGYNLDIINNDITIKGFPYKSASMVAQKVANFGLIPDPTNFWFTGGVPNQIPVVSLFQNIDYANQIFTKHISQSLDVNGVEIIEPKVLEIVTYSAALTGSNLTLANSYFGVSTATTPAKYVPGDYSTNTAALAAVSAGATIYNKSGVKTEAAQLLPNKTIFIKGVGYSVNNYGGAPSSLVYVSGISTLERLIFSGNGAVGIGFRFFSNNCIIEKVKMSNLTGSNQFVREGATNTLIKNSIFISPVQIGTFSREGVNLTFECCYISGTFTDGFFGRNSPNTEEQTVKYCKIITTNPTSSAAVLSTSVLKKFTFFSNKVYINELKILFNITPVAGTLDVKYNDFYITTTLANGSMLFDTLTKDITLNIENNRWLSSDFDGFFLSSYASNGGSIKNNYIRLIKPSVQFVDLKVGATLNIDGNCLNNVSATENNSVTNISVDSQALAGVSRNITIQKNKILNPLYFGSLFGWHNSIYIRDYINTVTKYNFMAGAGIYCLIIKSSTMIENIECAAMYNVSYLSGLLSKGQSFVKFYNNTVIDSLGESGIRLQAADDLTDIKTCYVKNNIVVNNINSNPLVLVSSEIIGQEHQINYNTYYSTNATPFLYKGVAKTFAQWQALGYDTNSVMLTTAQFNELFEDYANRDFRTKTSYLTGENLGVNYSIGLDKTTNWGTDTEIPTVVTKTQPATWQCGAYIQ